MVHYGIISYYLRCLLFFDNHMYLNRFHTKKQVIEYCRKVIKEQPPNIDFEDDVIFDLLKYRRDESERFAPGKKLQVRKSGHNNYCLHYGGMQFSMHTCVGLLPTRNRNLAQQQKARLLANIKEAFRFDIMDQKYAYRDKCMFEDGLIECEITHVVHDVANIHVDHNFSVITFATLVRSFIRDEKISLQKIRPLSAGPGNHTLPEPIRQKWQNYHRKHAVLRCIRKDINLKGVV